MKKRLLVGAILIGATAAQAHAACSQANAAGTWKLYAAATRHGTLGWVRCTLVIGGTGAFAISSICSNDSGEATGVTGALNLTNGASCTYSGHIAYTVPKIASSLIEATMAPSHETLGGVGTLVTGPFIFNMVRAQ